MICSHTAVKASRVETMPPKRKILHRAKGGLPLVNEAIKVPRLAKAVKQDAEPRTETVQKSKAEMWRKKTTKEQIAAHIEALSFQNAAERGKRDRIRRHAGQYSEEEDDSETEDDDIEEQQIQDAMAAIQESPGTGGGAATNDWFTKRKPKPHTPQKPQSPAPLPKKLKWYDIADMFLWRFSKDKGKAIKLMPTPLSKNRWNAKGPTTNFEKAFAILSSLALHDIKNCTVEISKQEKSQMYDGGPPSTSVFKANYEDKIKQHIKGVMQIKNLCELYFENYQRYKNTLIIQISDKKSLRKGEICVVGIVVAGTTRTVPSININNPAEWHKWNINADGKESNLYLVPTQGPTKQDPVTHLSSAAGALRGTTLTYKNDKKNNVWGLWLENTSQERIPLSENTNILFEWLPIIVKDTSRPRKLYTDYRQYDGSDDGKLWAVTENVEGSGQTSSETYLDAESQSTAGRFNLFNLMTRNPISIYSTNSVIEPSEMKDTANKSIIMVNNPAFVGLSHPAPEEATHALFVIQYSPNAHAEPARTTDRSKKTGNSALGAGSKADDRHNYKRFMELNPGDELELRWFYRWNETPIQTGNGGGGAAAYGDFADRCIIGW